jgi:hypothetical protein
MADTLSIDQLLANTAEPKRQHLWILSLAGIDAYTCTSTKRPGGGDFGEVTIDYINSKRFLAGKFTPATFDIKLWDPLAPSAAQKVDQWIKLQYENITGRAGYSAIYKKDFELKLLDPPGGVAEKWQIKGAWIKTVDYGTLDYTSDRQVEISLTLKYDSAVLLY